MKRLLTLLLVFVSSVSPAQSVEEEQSAKKLVEDFFEAFHEQDSVALRKLAHPDVQMQSISVDEHGRSRLSTEDYSDFLKSLISIPETTRFKEKLHDFEIQVNGPLANVITPYSFYVNDELSHCGVNTFNLFKTEEEWKIIYLVDTRERINCK